MGTADRILHISIFGMTRMRRLDAAPEEDAAVKGMKPRQILGMLALRPGEPLSKDLLAERLWDGRPPRSYLASLESYVCVLRRQLSSVADSSGHVGTTSRGYVLVPDMVQVDADLFRSQVQRLWDAAPSEIVARTQEAVELVGGPLLASEPYEPWAEEERRSFEALLIKSCLCAAGAAQAAADHARAIQLADRVLQVDPLVETAWLIRLEGLAATSQRLEALRSYAAMESVLKDELGVEPSPEAQRLQLALLGSGTPSGAETGNDVRTLLRLLRRTLERIPGLDVPPEDADLSAVAARLVSAA
jgi:DNA-binding SARP family transcriptional activator